MFKEFKQNVRSVVATMEIVLPLYAYVVLAIAAIVCIVGLVINNS